MNKSIAIIALSAIASASIASAEPSGIFRQTHEFGFGEKSSLDPISEGRVFQITDKIMNRLVRPDLDRKPSPDLAVSWEPNADGTEWTFHLREGVKFHDGTDLDSEDVVYSFTRVKDPQLDSPARSAISMVDSIAAVDPLTVKMTLSAPFADLPFQLMDYRLRIIPSGSGDSIAQSGIGTGPFKVETFDAQGTTVLSAFNDYFEGPPKLAAMEIFAIPDAQARIQALLGGQIDMLRDLTKQQSTMLMSSDKFEIQEIVTGTWQGMVMRTDTPPFDDPRVRKAVRLAADREVLVQLVFAGGALPACDSPVGRSDQYYVARDCPQDIEGAKALLNEAGYPDGIEFELHISTLEPAWVTYAEAYQQQAAEAGITVHIVQVPASGYWNDAWMKKPVSMTRWFSRPADLILNEAFVSGAKWNESFQNNETFDNLLVAARKEIDFGERRNLYVQAQDILWEEGGVLIPYHLVKYVGLSSRVKNMDNTERDGIRWHLVSVD